MDLAALQFDHGTLMLTEASSQKRAAVVGAFTCCFGWASYARLNPLDCSIAEFTAVLKRANNTLKRALTDPSRFDGIGNAYSDEILHSARLSPLQLTGRLTESQWRDLHVATGRTLSFWIDYLKQQTGQRFRRRLLHFV